MKGCFWQTEGISIHALREEGDKRPHYHAIVYGLFLSTPSARRATLTISDNPVLPSYFYPRPPRGGRQNAAAFRINVSNFYPRPPRGGRLAQSGKKMHQYKFLSTPSARRATLALTVHLLPQQNFYPRPPRGGRPFTCSQPRLVDVISIHALREEGDFGHFIKRTSHILISIHALREEGDRFRLFAEVGCQPFLSTPSARRATYREAASDCKQQISIHALREEGDSKNREKTLCFCLIIHLSAQIAKRCL